MSEDKTAAEWDFLDIAADVIGFNDYSDMEGEHAMFVAEVLLADMKRNNLRIVREVEDA